MYRCSLNYKQIMTLVLKKQDTSFSLHSVCMYPVVILVYLAINVCKWQILDLSLLRYTSLKAKQSTYHI